MTALPTDLTFGFVTGRYILLVGDTSADPDALPDARPALDLKVTFTPTATVHRTSGGTVMRAPLTCGINADGYVCEIGSAEAGVFLITGTYKVVFSGLSSHALPAPLEINVLETHTEENPLDLTLSADI